MRPRTWTCGACWRRQALTLPSKRSLGNYSASWWKSSTTALRTFWLRFRQLLLKALELLRQGGPLVQEPTRRSFGSKLIEHAFVAQLQAKARLKFDPGGVRYELEVPLAVLNASLSR